MIPLWIYSMFFSNNDYILELSMYSQKDLNLEVFWSLVHIWECIYRRYVLNILSINVSLICWRSSQKKKTILHTGFMSMFSLTWVQVSFDFPQVCPGGHPHNRIRLHETLHHVTLSPFPLILKCLFSFPFFLSVSRQAVVSLLRDHRSSVTDSMWWSRGTTRFLAGHTTRNVQGVEPKAFLLHFNYSV